MKKAIASIFITSVLSGCVTPPKMNQSFEYKDVEWVHEKGTAIVTGQAFLKTVGGDVKTCAGNTIKLVPSSAYSDERIKYVYGNSDTGYYPQMTFLGKRLPEAPSSYYEYVLNSICDANGNFEFNDVPEGNFYLLVPVVWKLNANSMSAEGGSLMRYISVKSDAKNKYIMTN